MSAGDETVSVDLRPTRDGRTALLVYSALDRLVGCCGDRQPWVVMATASLDTVQEATRFDLLLLDVDIPPELRRRDGQPASGTCPSTGSPSATR
ncbi:hypothetical protein BJF78_19880 [Pseudonocardia sp. CNS-139]|nr:hypothetical protein BJF78_19880 [Pseudonocardia sp. CNS-139]